MRELADEARILAGWVRESSAFYALRRVDLASRDAPEDLADHAARGTEYLHCEPGVRRGRECASLWRSSDCVLYVPEGGPPNGHPQRSP